MTGQSLTMVRHAPTESNGAHVFMGSKDVPATADGLRLAAARSAAFSALGCTPIFTSPLQRASATARALFPTGLIRTDSRLAERDLGEWAGQSQERVRADYPAAFLDNGVLDPRFTPPGGEDLATFERRIRAFLRDLAGVSQEGSPAAVSHNGWIRTALYVLGRIGVEEIFTEGVPFLEPLCLDLRPLTVGRIPSP
ncbi:histidine phosphatase family protein [Streptomyces sp. NPDC056580]|uniref:histidine phosphatase family protein n=1 Tax=Streptomyces sp. NPDC056580 TaxID=3345872 RepID=UPI0036886A0B